MVSLHSSIFRTYQSKALLSNLGDGFDLMFICKWSLWNQGTGSFKKYLLLSKLR